MMLDDDNLILPDRRPPRADALKNRAVLLDTAARLFAERGVEGTTMSAIADAANVGKGTLYRHFEHKIDICLALLDQEQRALQERTLRYLRQSSNTSLEDLHWFLGQIVDFVARHLELLDVIGDTAGPNSLDVRAHAWWRQTMRALLARSGVPAPDPLDYFSNLLFIMVDARTLRFLMRSQGYTRERVLEGLHITLNRLIF
jgi:AcrR family transcriptional regulator